MLSAKGCHSSESGVLVRVPDENSVGGNDDEIDEHNKRDVPRRVHKSVVPVFVNPREDRCEWEDDAKDNADANGSPF